MNLEANNIKHNIESINKLIANLPNTEDVNKISDGYHTFGELYQHRVILYIVLCNFLQKHNYYIWRSKLHSDGSSIEGFFVLGINIKKGEQITYHIRNQYWDSVKFAETLDVTPKYDGHTSQDALTRLSHLLNRINS